MSRTQQHDRTNGGAPIHSVVAPEPKERLAVISPPKFEQAVIEIRGISPYVQHRFAQKQLLKMEAKQKAGSQSGKGMKREPRKPEDDYQSSMYSSREGWNGIPASAFRNGCISACKIVGFAMTRAKLSVFVLPDGFDHEDGTPLVRIYGTPHMHVATARNDDGGADIRYRAMWDQWIAKPRFRWDADQFSASDVLNLVTRLGLQVGIGEGRFDSKNSPGLGWGNFEVGE
jgi:hypothetical protein